ncbi:MULTISPECIES: GIY-YIG nuclease family protein [unclassified Streptococcus]|jgi:uncharacterized protein yeeC|uniref:GIY-YIG nuclease family protein n=1 Tax=unclassified Streptococcus TaxID=2608887 RepID=UPI000EDA2E07|nr:MULTISPECIES: GIY-YIG nuclease family protein [unclassified Streptococcus]MBZ1354181.1 GIY-YIG nuclease family protein [Streptococcus sp. LPB0406]MDU2419327.1 GIY-YIG nuclease family protein [Streptococcus parasanguinis]MCP8962912.1 GIY-YIG nuclease family protein [Streptococcus sp. CF8_St5-12]MCP8980853.1 GIY-YIG nuclease family protein [Streptococcus sp. CF8_St5-16]MCP8982701.1 GIY-YIG nuclease family protein [Streptococcus sp. CF8_St5-13]
MTDFKNLEDIFNDSDFEKLVSPLKPKEKKVADREVEKFIEIVDWVRENNGHEPQKSRDIKERSLYSRLYGIRKSPDSIRKLEPYDEFGLLKIDVVESDTPISSPTSLKEILSDELFESVNSAEKSLFDVSRYKRTIQARDKTRTRKRMGNFEDYQGLFTRVHDEISEGCRQVRKSDVIKEKEIKPGMFYVDNGVMVYVVSKGEYFIDKNGYTNAELHLVYENGTENKNALLRSFVSNLHDRTRHGRMVTELIEDVMGGVSPSERITTGYIYVVKSLSTNPQIAGISNLYKIGFTQEKIEKRLANAEKEGTYLYAPVHLVASFEVQNFSARKLETTLHHYFSDKQLEVELTAPNGENFVPKEWFLVSLDEIQEAIYKIGLEISVR